MEKGHKVQDIFLDKLCKEGIKVSIFMKNGIKLQGTIDSFDPFIVMLKNVGVQTVYKHAISTILPSCNVRIGNENSDNAS